MIGKINIQVAFMICTETIAVCTFNAFKNYVKLFMYETVRTTAN